MRKLTFKDYKPGDEMPQKGTSVILEEAYAPDPLKPKERVLRLWCAEE